jgi:anti-anti-sigma regulatory factor
MKSWITQLLAVRTDNPDLQRRGQILIAIASGMAVLSILFVPMILMINRQVPALITLIVAAFIFLGAALLGRAGQITTGSYLVIGVTIGAILISIRADATTSSTPFYLVLAIMLAGVLLPPPQIWVVLAICVVGEVLLFSLLPAELRAQRIWQQSAFGTPLILGMAALIMFISAQTLNRALHQATRANAEAQQALAALSTSNASLEVRVLERTAELTKVLELQQATTTELESSLTAQRSLNQVIAELSVPVIPITKDALVVPLVGAIDSTRAGLLLDEVLRQIERARAKVVMLDVTGVAVVDTQVAAALLQVAAAARLMGTETVLVGIRPEVAQTLVGLGVDLATLRTAASLQDGLAVKIR